MQHAQTVSHPLYASAEPLESRRLLSAGDLDTSFGGGDGVAPFTFVSQFDDATPNAIVAIGDGTFVAVGTTDPFGDGNTAMAIVRYKANGALDGSFGVGGVVITDFGPGADEAHAVALTPGGGVVVAGMTTQGAEQDVAVARYNADGTLDRSFSDDGIVRAGFVGRADVAYDVIVNPAGKVFFAGSSGSDFLVGRLNPDGTNDARFSDDGLVLAGFGKTEAARGIAFLSGGRVAAAGWTSASGGDLAFAVFTSTGGFDTSFGRDGRATLDFGSGGVDLTNDLLVTAGRLVSLGSTTPAGGGATEVAIARLTTSGEADTSFNGDGRAVVTEGNALNGVWDGNQVVTSSGIVVDGAIGELISVSGPEGLVARADSNAFVGVRAEFVISKTINGQTDPNFGGPGILVLNDYVGKGDVSPRLFMGEVGRDIVRQADGKVLVLAQSRGQALVARYNADGSVDTTFGFQGRAIADFSGVDPLNTFRVEPVRIVVTPDGRILVGASLVRDEMHSIEGEVFDRLMGFAFARFTADGVLDATFGGGDGLIPGPEVGFDSLLMSLALLPDGGFIGAGSAGSVVPLLAKFNADGSPDTSFGFDGVLQVSGGGGRGIRFDVLARWVTPSPGGKIVFGGTLDAVLDENLSGRSGFGVARLNPDGSLDNSFSGDGVLRDNPDWSSVDEVPGGIRYHSNAVVLPDGRILAVDSGGVTRITAAGAIDTTFGGGDGYATAPPGLVGFAYSMFVDAAGRILVGGTVSPHSISVARFTPNGKVDTTFGDGDGLVTRSIPSDDEFAHLIRLEPGEDNTFYAYTTLGAGTVARFEVLRFQNGAGGPPPTGPTIGIVNDILIADGRWGADRITIERIGTDNVIVSVNDLTREFDMDEFDGILLRGNAGYDDIRVLDPLIAETRVRMVTIEGGNGNDILQGSSADEVIRAGTGNDRVFGGAGADSLDGGDNDDFIDASDSAAGDTVLGGDGNDTATIDAGDRASGVEKFA